MFADCRPIPASRRQPQKAHYSGFRHRRLRLMAVGSRCRLSNTRTIRCAGRRRRRFGIAGGSDCCQSCYTMPVSGCPVLTGADRRNAENSTMMETTIGNCQAIAGDDWRSSRELTPRDTTRAWFRIHSSIPFIFDPPAMYYFPATIRSNHRPKRSQIKMKSMEPNYFYI